MGRENGLRVVLIDNGNFYFTFILRILPELFGFGFPNISYSSILYAAKSETAMLNSMNSILSIYNSLSFCALILLTHSLTH